MSRARPQERDEAGTGRDRAVQCSAAIRPPPIAAPLTNANDGTGARRAAEHAVAVGADRGPAGARDVRDAGEVGADAEHERLARDGDGDDLARLAAAATWSRVSAKRVEAAEAEGVRLGVVEPLSRRDQRRRRHRRQVDGRRRARDDLVRARPGWWWSRSRRSRPAVVVRVLPDDRAAHAETDAHGRQAVADLGCCSKLFARWAIRRMPEEASGWPTAMALPKGFTRGSSSAMPKCVEEGEHLDGERLVDLEQADGLETPAGDAFSVLRTGPTPSGSTTPGGRRRRQAGLLREAELVLATSSAVRIAPVAPSLRPAALPR